jgi:hypothetical protein
LNPTWEKEAAYSYYAHGPLARTVIGEQEVQGLDYVYTLQGWIKGVNSNNLDANNDPGKDGLGLSANHRVAQDVMGYSLHYFNNDYLPIVNGNTTFIADQSNSDMLQNSSDLYNGNIARMVTTITDPNSRAVLPLGNAYQYDQLNRLKHAVSFDQLNGNAWAGGAPAKYENSFTYDANGNILTQERWNDANQKIDQLQYNYKKNSAGKLLRNRLYSVDDNVVSTVFADDIDDMNFIPGNTIETANNYKYDQEGRLIQDLQEGIDEINWRVDGKVKSIKQSDNKLGEYSLSFDYDAFGHRIAKHSYDKDQAYNNGLGQLVKSTYYVLDAQGNTMATYERAVDENTQQISYAQTEKFIYGSSRLGVQNCNIGLLGSQNNTYTQTTVPHRIGKKGYELSNHLGNVLSVLSDKVIPHSNGATVDYWLADINQSTDFSAFHAPLIGRTLYKSNNTLDYRYGGSNGQEKTDEVAGNGNHYTAEYWEYDTRLGRRWNLDPVVKEHESPYTCFANNPIWFMDPNGADTISVMSDKLDENGKELKKDDKGDVIDGQKRLLLFKAYTNDEYKGELGVKEFQSKYQMLAKKVSSSTDGASNDKQYAEFISINSNKKLVKKALFITTIGQLNNFSSKALSEVGGVGGGLNSLEKITLFNHGEEYDYKSQMAKGFGLTYVEGVGIFESDHLGNIIYGSVAARAGQGLNSSLYDGDWLTNGAKTDDPYDSYSLAMGHFFGQKGITKTMLKMNNVNFVKTTTITTLTYNQGFYGKGSYDESYERKAFYTITVAGKKYSYSNTTHDASTFR